MKKEELPKYGFCGSFHSAEWSRCSERCGERLAGFCYLGSSENVLG
jgi:hypothetical protein